MYQSYKNINYHMNLNEILNRCTFITDFRDDPQQHAGWCFDNQNYEITAYTTLRPGMWK